MRTKGLVMRFSFSVVLLILTGCNLPSSLNDPQSTLAYDAILATAQAGAAGTLTQEAMSAPSLTAAPVLTETATVQAVTQAVPTSNQAMVSVSKETNCRVGNDVSFERVGGLLPGVTAEVIAMDTTKQYYYIRNPQKPTEFCWIWGFYATTVGDLNILPLFTAMPTPTVTVTPTATPNFSVVYTKLDACVGTYVEIKVQNTGSTNWLSGSVIAKDTVTGTSTSERISDQFEDWNGCLSASPIQGDLVPGESGSLHSFDFLYSPAGHEIQVTIKLCSQDGMAGICMSKQGNFTP
jgi:hypothetical protein